MRRHIFYIDPLEKLNPKKDSSLLMALTAQKEGLESLILFKADLYFLNTQDVKYSVHKFAGEIDSKTQYINSFRLEGPSEWEPRKGDVFHFRPDPPFDQNYLRILWMLEGMKSKGVQIINDPRGVLAFNEKMVAYTRESSIPSYVGNHKVTAIQFITSLKSQGIEFIITKPLDLYQGIGVIKHDLSQFSAEEIFEKAQAEYQTQFIIQPYLKSVETGEVRSIYFKGQELGTIIKIPPKGDFLANIARGASYQAYELTSELKQECLEICNDLGSYGVDFVAFDILDGKVSEVNITCPGLLVEVSSAHQKNLAQELFKLLD